MSIYGNNHSIPLQEGHDPEELEVLRDLFFSPLHYFA